MSELITKVKDAVKQNVLIAKENNLSKNGIKILNHFLINYSKDNYICNDFSLSNDLEGKISNFDLKSDGKYYIMHGDYKYIIFDRWGKFASEECAKTAIKSSISNHDGRIVNVYRVKDLKKMNYKIDIVFTD